MKRNPIIVVCGILLTFFLFWYYRAHPLGTQVEIRGRVFTVEVAVTEEEKQLGLGNRDSLVSDHAMLFVYQSPGQYSFWMKGMRFPIDIIWIKDQTIVDISKNVPVSTTSALPSYAPKEPVNKILEINAGIVDRLGIEVGDTVRFLR